MRSSQANTHHGSVGEVKIDLYVRASRGMRARIRPGRVGAGEAILTSLAYI